MAKGYSKSEKILKQRVPRAPDLNLIWTAIVDVGTREDLGSTPAGQRFIVPILVGKFFADPGMPGLSGEVLPGGADRQLVDRHGFKTLDALYEMRTDEGDTLTVHNRVRIDESGPTSYRRSVINVTAPQGKLDWMNRRIFIGTLETARPDRAAVIVRGWG